MSKIIRRRARGSPSCTRTVTANVSSFHLKGKFICILNVFDCFSVYVCLYFKSLRLTPLRLFRCYRWAAFRQVIDDTDRNLKSVLNGDQNVKFLQHVSVNSGYRCVDMRKWFQSFYDADDIKPTKRGVSLRLNDRVVRSVQSRRRHKQSVSVSRFCSTLLLRRRPHEPCRLLNCTECHPFLVNLSPPPPTNAVA